MEALSRSEADHSIKLSCFVRFSDNISYNVRSFYIAPSTSRRNRPFGVFFKKPLRSRAKGPVFGIIRELVTPTEPMARASAERQAM
jgi:hypothetical protein